MFFYAESSYDSQFSVYVMPYPGLGFYMVEFSSVLIWQHGMLFLVVVIFKDKIENRNFLRRYTTEMVGVTA